MPLLWSINTLVTEKPLRNAAQDCSSLSCFSNGARGSREAQAAQILATVRATARANGRFRLKPRALSLAERQADLSAKEALE